MRRALLLAAALAIPVSGAAVVGLNGGVAGAKTVKTTCTTITGTITSTIVVSGCTGGNTGGSSEPIEATDLASGGTIDWVAGTNTVIQAPALKSTSAKKCPGYTKGGDVSAESFTAVVTSTNTGDLPATNGKATGAVCINSETDAVTALKPLVSD
jgi:hypothetical protein